MDVMLFSFVYNMLTKLHTARWAWFLFWPPFGQPLGIACGLAFLFSERPSIGRTFSVFVLWNISNSVLVTVLCLAALDWQSWIFDFLLLGFSISLRMALFIVANIHVANVQISAEVRHVDIVEELTTPLFAGSSGGGSSHPHGSNQTLSTTLRDKYNSFDRQGPRSGASISTNSGQGSWRPWPESRAGSKASTLVHSFPMAQSPDSSLPSDSGTPVFHAISTPRASPVTRQLSALRPEAPENPYRAAPF
jgi:hypothetical protein